MYRITFCLDLFRGPEDMELSHKALQRMLDCLFDINCDYLRANPAAPGIYDTDAVTKKRKVHYHLEDAGVEDWLSIPIAASGVEYTDCEDLACWRAAELKVRYNIDAHPTFRFKRRASGSFLYHVLVALPQGLSKEDKKRANIIERSDMPGLEDPSQRTGMNKHKEY